jgi:hypothetical protein
MTTGRRIRWRALVGAWVLLLAWPVAAARAADAPALPADARLDTVRAPLEKLMSRAAQDGLPAEMIAGKVREGLAKGVAPDAIRAAAERLATSLGNASRFVRAHRAAGAPPAPASLIQVVAEADLAGVELDSLLPLVASGDGDVVVGRAVAVVTDLAMRGYPSRRSGAVVREIADRDARSLGRVVAGVEAIRVEQTVSRADALEALGRNLATGGTSLDAAVARALESGDRAGNASGSSPGKSAEAPGHTGNTGVSKVKKPKK